MREKYVEQRLIRAVRQKGGLALKLVSPGFNGVPDRLLLFMGGKLAFCEVNAPGQKPRPLQTHQMEQLRKMGFKVFVVDSTEGIREMLESILLQYFWIAFFVTLCAVLWNRGNKKLTVQGG